MTDAHAAPADTEGGLKKTPLYALHVELGGKMVPFAGYEMPVQYPAGVMKEHQQCRTSAALFDVSHMGQARLTGDDVAAALETVVPGDIKALAAGRQRYSVLTNPAGGILDDFMVANTGEDYWAVVNAACKEADLAHLDARIGGSVDIAYLGDDRGLLALQGPEAAKALTRLIPVVETMPFMSAIGASLEEVPLFITRSGYTGEDGFEISIPAEETEKIARLLLAQPEVAPAGLGARDSLRLEAGLCLYGHDIDETTTPVEAGLSFIIGKRRRAEGGFPGADVILKQLAEGAGRKRVGILPEGRQPAREGSKILAGGVEIGTVTSGGFGPTLGGPMAMGYVPAEHAAVDTPLELEVRGKRLAARVAATPFVPQRYYRAP